MSERLEVILTLNLKYLHYKVVFDLWIFAAVEEKCFEKLPALPLSAVAKEGSPAPRAGSPAPSVALSHPVTFQTCGGPCLHSRLV